MPGQADVLLCSFCGKSQHQVKKLIAGPGLYICDECVALCNEILDEDLSPESSEASRQAALLRTQAQMKREEAREKMDTAQPLRDEATELYRQADELDQRAGELDALPAQPEPEATPNVDD